MLEACYGTYAVHFRSSRVACKQRNEKGAQDIELCSYNLDMGWCIAQLHTYSNQVEHNGFGQRF